MNKAIIMLIGTTLFLSACATNPTLNLEMAGSAVPGHIYSAEVLGLDMFMMSVLSVYYKEKEDDEFLDINRYLDYRIKQKLKSEGLQSVVLSATLINPRRKEYRVSGVILSSAGKTVSREILYSGNLSRKEVKYNLPTYKSFSGNVLVEISSQDGRVLFQWMPLQYEVK